jgi:hypothetical protein
MTMPAITPLIEVVQIGHMQITLTTPIAFHEQFGPGYDSLYLLTYLVKQDSILGHNKY